MSVIRYGILVLCLLSATGCRSMGVFGRADESETAERPSINDIGKNAD